MSGLYGRPTAAELVAAVADFLDNDVRAAADSRAARSTSMPALPRTCCASSSVNCSTSRPTTSPPRWPAWASRTKRALAAAIRAGDVDDRPDDVLACLRTVVRRRLDVAHPGYAE